MVPFVEQSNRFSVEAENTVILSMKTQMHYSWFLAVGLLAAGLLAGCHTRSISDSGYRSHSGYAGKTANAAYKGELSEFDVLGVRRDNQITDEQIHKALDAATRVRLRKGSSLLLIQSGADQPDSPMSRALSQHFNTVPFNGKPDFNSDISYTKALRLAAAQAACETIVCYWGALESARRNLETKTVSWVPVVGWMVPDEKQHMRIRLKVALIDVRSGNWTMFSPEAFDDRAISTLFTKSASDQAQVEKLKRLAYEAAANDLVKTYAN